MAKGAKSTLALGLTLLLAISTWMSMAEGSKKPVGVARKEDIPYIKCQVCEKVASELYHQVQKKQDQISPKKISEYQVIEMAENVCNLKKEEADWILKVDIVEQGDKLELVDQGVEGQCNSECKTIERACQEVVGYSDTDLAEYLYKRKPQLEDLINYLCTDLTESCAKKPPPVPKNRTPGEPFIPKPTKEAEMEKMLRSMEGMPGAPGMKMYSREELMNMKNFGGEGADEDDDDDDDENFPSNLGRVIREKESEKADWKEKVTKHIAEAGQTVKRHANKVSHKVRQWWRAKRAAVSKKKTTGSSKADL